VALAKVRVSLNAYWFDSYEDKYILVQIKYGISNFNSLAHTPFYKIKSRMGRIINMMQHLDCLCSTDEADVDCMRVANIPCNWSAVEILVKQFYCLRIRF